MILICDHRGMALLKALRPLRGAGFELESTLNLRESRAQLEAQKPDLVILDPLGSSGSVEIDELVRICSADPATPILLVSDPGAPDAILSSAQQLNGIVWDVVRRDAGPAEYSLRITRLLAEAKQAAELVDLRYRAAHDDLTDLWRPLYFQARLEEHFSAAQRHGLDLSLVLVDLDDFGIINKRFDHTIGDRVLAHVARAIRKTLRAEDIAGRIGGDEFAIVLPYTGTLEAAFTVQRICQVISELSGCVSDDKGPLSVSASIGFESTNGVEIASVEDLRSNAEYALKRAKKSGGNRAVFFRSR
ncbi:MAG: diguanylate cyclase (GGDEF)-like protein [Planctomycetota bacterium]|jgi:diguanylate cyclase (GGDEF)-like protein